MDESSSNQMERPSRPKDAIPAERSSEDQGSVPSPDPPSTRPSTRPSSDPPSKRSSPELPSTRPNPFDEGDVLARKRRRTSGSASPQSPALPRGEAHAASLSNHANASEPSANDAIPAVQVAESSHTPRTPVNFLPFDCAPNSSTPPSSSKVTLNLKNSNGLAVDAPKPSSPSNMRPASDIVTDSRSNTEAETMDYNTEQQPQMPTGASSKSTSDSISPSVELIVVSDADSEEGNDDMVLSYEENATGFGSNEFSSSNPILQFPFSEPDDDPSAPLHRVLDYLSTQSSIDSKIITQVQAWIEDHLQFAGSTELSIVRDSREAYRIFWLVLPNVMFHLSIRSSDLCKIPELRNSIIDFYSSFTCLAARMISLDALAIKDWQATSQSDCRQYPELFSPKYLRQLHEVLSPDHSGTNSQNEAQHYPGWPRQHEIESYLIDKFQASPGGNVDDLSQLASFIASLLPENPKLVDALAPVAQIFAACIRKAALTTGHDQSTGRVRQTDVQFEAGHLVWLHLSDCLDLMIEKHVTQLSTETATALLNAALEILKCALRGSHQQAVDELQEHMRVFPGLSITHTVEAMAWKWGVRVLERLIRSGQMQLRVMAITKLCGDLVCIWQTAGNASDEDTSLFIEHLGNHLLQTHLVDYIFGSNCHPEIIVESANVLGFLIVTKMYNQQHTDRLWQGLTGRQDSHVAEALARMITSITGLLDYSGLVAWCEKFQTLPLAGFSLSMRTLWESLMENMIKRCQSEQRVPTLHPFKLCLRLLREASICTQGCQTADTELQFAAMQKLRELLALGPSPEDRGTLFVSCIDDIAQKSSTSLGSLWCLSMAIRGTVPRDLQVLTEQHDLARLVIEELAHAIGAGRQAGAIAVLSGDSNMPRRDLIMNIIHLQPSAIEDELGTRLLDILVGPDSSCEEDRAAGWLVILSVMRQSSLKNSFLQTCFSKYLPSLPASCFSDGMLDFVRERALSLAGDNSDFALDDSESLSTSGLEQLWRIILEADDSPLVARAICTLAVDLYLESNAMRRCPMPRARRVHLSLVSRCMDQMKSAATWIRGSVEGVSGNDDVRLATASKDVELRRQELIFRRSLQLLKFFLEKHQAHPKFSVPDLRPFMASALNKTVGCSAELKFQAFDGCDQSSIQHLEIGRQNTVACLLAEIQRVTGFENYRIYYRGQQWCPSENQIGLTLYELHMQDDIMLVKREEDISSTAEGMKPGSSQLEIEILAHFKELWEYLGMEEKFAEDIYDFLAQLPADGEFTARFDSDDASYLDIFHKGYPFRTLYAIHAIGDYVEAAQYQRDQADLDAEGASERLGSFQQAIEKSLRLVVDAIADPDLLDGVSPALRLRIAGSLVRIYVKIFTVATQKTPRVELESSVLPSATRLYEIICLAKEHDGYDSSFALIDHACAAILRVGSESLDFWNAVISETKIMELIANLVLKDPRKLVKQTVAELIEDATSAHTNTSSVVHTEDLTNGKQKSHYMLVSLCSAMIAILPECMDHQSEPEEYFRLMLHLLEQSQNKCPSAIDIETLAVTTLDLLLQHTSMEAIDQPNVIDPFAAGLTSLLHTCLQRDVKIATSAAVDGDSATRLFWRHLFPKKRRGERNVLPRVIHNLPTRMKLLEIILVLVMHKRIAFSKMLDTMNGLVPFYSDEPDDPYKYELPYSFDRSKAVRAPCGYVGLRNLSNTCYLNSLFTQLFMNTQFRSFILSIDIEDQGGSQELLFRTQKLFAYMQESYQRYVDPYAVISSIKTYDDTPIDVHSQMDVDEFYNLLFDRWEGQLLESNEKKKLRSFFGGQLVQQVKSKECEHISERLEPFSAIQCDIKGKSTLQESLQAYVDGEIMEGENKYKCSTCDRHVDAVKRACLKDVPDNLICHLKRFEFNLRTMQRSKINDYFSFPLSLDISPYTVEYLNAEDEPPQSDVFELVGILVHSGTAESGHYYSYIRERGPSDSPAWVEFNDDTVTPWDPSSMESATFGSTDRQPIHETANKIRYHRAFSAYMLFYQRASSLHAGLSANTAANSESRFIPTIPPPLKEQISKENNMLLQRHCLFDPGYTLFVQQCFAHAIQLGEAEPAFPQPADNGKDDMDADESLHQHQLQSLAMELALSHYDQVVTRTKDLPFVGNFSSLLHNAIAKCYNCALAFHSYFSMRPSAFRAVATRNPDMETRRFICRSLLQAAEKVRKSNPRLYHGSSPTRTFIDVDAEDAEEDADGDENWAICNMPRLSVLQGTVDIFNYLWRFFHVNIRSWDEYFAMIWGFARNGDLEVSYLLGEDYLLKLLRIIIADPMTDQPVNYQRMMANLMRRFANKPASYVSIISLIDYLMSQLEPTLSAEVIVDEAADRRGMQQPFAWTSEEFQAIHHHPERQISSLFVEKLLDLDQAFKQTSSILSRMIRTGDELDMKVFATLRKQMQGDTSAKPMDPAIRAAALYVECSESTERAQTLIRHVCIQARCLQHSEGPAFMRFVAQVLSSSQRLDRTVMDAREERRKYATELIPLWAPYLLIYPDEQTRMSAEVVVNDALFERMLRTPPGQAVDDVDVENEDDDAVATAARNDDEERMSLLTAIRQVGIKCLMYLREVHVKRGIQLDRHAAGSISRVISKCSQFYGPIDGVNEDDAESVEFAAIQAEIRSPLQRLLVDEVDEDGSDWDGSCASSEFLEANVGIAMQTGNEASD